MLPRSPTSSRSRGSKSYLIKPLHPYTPTPLHPYTPTPLHPYTPTPPHPNVCSISIKSVVAFPQMRQLMLNVKLMMTYIRV
ncbi:hypothetical protein [Nostoc sp. UHCC 0870]|uniref:hypothetical protein n=1 Tax=Nostoc sp. UHCC 0870 TaxID=2914041 RepID=UPI0030DC8DD3